MNFITFLATPDTRIQNRTKPATPRLRLLSSIALAAVVLAAFLCPQQAIAEGLQLEVTGGKVDVQNWVAQTTLDLATASKLLGCDGSPAQVAVYELDAQGQPAEKPVTSQVDSDTDKHIYTVAWRVPGKLAAGATRRFLIQFDASSTSDESEPIIRAEAGKDTLTVTNGNIVLEHQRGTGGMIRRVTVAGTTGNILWLDKIHDGVAYYMAKANADRMDIKAQGPLRAVIEIQSAYREASSGQRPPSKPSAVYRFTSYAGLPFTIIEALVSQEFSHQWSSMHFIEMGTGDAGFTHVATDNDSGATLDKTGRLTWGSKWAAVYNQKLLIATCASSQPGVYDGGGKHYSQYLRGGKAALNTLSYRWKDAIFWGPGRQAVEDQTVQHWSEVLSAPPTVRIIFDTLAKRLKAVKTLLKEKENSLTILSGKEWAAEHVALTLARGQITQAQKKLDGGKFKEALTAVESSEKVLNGNSGQTQLVQAGPVLAGLVLGHPYLGNDKAVYLWAKPGDGAGLVSVFDRQSSRELLGGDSAQATFWEVTVKQDKGGASFSNKGQPCQLDAFADEAGGRLVFRWAEGIDVQVETRLSADEALLRGRIKASTKSTLSGLLAITFPVVKGVKPLTPQASRDVVLQTNGFGNETASPLVSGEESVTGCPPGMQFTALIGDGMGLYFAEEDGQANSKQLAWKPDANAESLDFSINHQVLNWGSDVPVQDYQSPGDIVLGPFHGNWYDAAKIYRKWAITSPWCAKGPIYEREDYPKWLLKAPYWTIAYLPDESGIEDEIKKQAFFEVPTMVAHTYNYYFTRHLDDRYPEYFPPMLGSEGLKKAIKLLQSKGIRVVPYLNGTCWDTDTDSYRLENVEEKGTSWPSPTQKATISTTYGDGASLAIMCPGSPFWRKTMWDAVDELVDRYGADGVYFDFLTTHNADGSRNCYNKEHGHPICGGNFWAKAVHDLYAGARKIVKKYNPQAMLTGEGAAEFCIDVHDTFLDNGVSDMNAPLFQAVYHGYANLYGALYGNNEPVIMGRWWLLGSQSGWHGSEVAMAQGRFPVLGKYYKDLLKLRWAFATPYLGYGEMIRPPKIEGVIPTVTREGPHGPFKVSLVESSAWKAPDGTVGIFFLNYDQKNPYDFTWTVNLVEAGIDKSKKIKISRWTQDSGLSPLKNVEGGALTEKMRIKPLGIIALKLEVIQ